MKKFTDIKGRAQNYQYSSSKRDEVIFKNVAHGHITTCGGNKRQTHKGWIYFDIDGKKFKLFASTYKTQTGLNITMAKMEKQ